MFVPPDNFALVEKGIYRSSRITNINFQFLKTLQLKSILWIDEESVPRALSAFIDDNHIRLIKLKSFEEEEDEDDDEDEDLEEENKEWMIIKPKVMSKILKCILDYKQNSNMLIVDKMEFITGMIRKLQKWTYSAILNEYRLFIGNKFNYFVEIYLEMIDIEILNGNGNNSTSSKLKEREKLKIEDDEIEDDNGIISTQSTVKSISINKNNTDSIPIHKDNMDQEIINSIKSMGISLNRNMNSFKEFNSGSGDFKTSTSFNHGSSITSSLSPQIPKNLLKLIEKRRGKKEMVVDNAEEEKVDTVNVDAKENLDVQEGEVESKESIRIKSYNAKNGKSQKNNKTNSVNTNSDKETKVINPISNTVLVKLPAYENLPYWFTALLEDCENDYTTSY